MPKVRTEAYTHCPELIEAVKIIDDLAYSRRYSEVFDDLVNWVVWEHHFPPIDKNPLEKYSKKEQDSFLEIFKIIQSETKKRTDLWKEPERRSAEWYDPFGRLYECITSKNKSSMMGQFFTPKHVVDLMVQLNPNKQASNFSRVIDPTCGSGRMGLSAAAHSMVKRKPIWITMNDIDPICTKMTAANMCLNGIVGEATCADGLDITGESYRFGYRVEPMILQIPTQMQGLYRMAMMAKTGQDIQKQYVVKPVTYEQTYLKQVNDNLLNELEERQHITDAEEREKSVNDLKEKVNARMKGTLFDGDTSQAENIIAPMKASEKIKKQRKNKDNPPDSQPTLF